jgi:hypothetical protein
MKQLAMHLFVEFLSVLSSITIVARACQWAAWQVTRVDYKFESAHGNKNFD